MQFDSSCRAEVAALLVDAAWSIHHRADYQEHVDFTVWAPT